MSTTTSYEGVRSTTASGSSVYESKRAVDEYLLFHFGATLDNMPYNWGPYEALAFPQKSAAIIKQLMELPSSVIENGRVLDVGCAVGGASFEFSKLFNKVVGLDFSEHFIDAANKLKTERRISYDMKKQGNIFVPREYQLPEDVDTSTISFVKGDACKLDEAIGTEQYDIIHAANLLCRLPSPRKFISDVPKYLKPGGFLVLISPYSWLEEYTAPEEWFGGRVIDGVNVDSFVELKSFIEPNLNFVYDEDIPFLIREHERKFQYGVSHCTVWVKPDASKE